MVEAERRRLDVLLELVEILGAGRAPGQDLGRARLAEALEGAMTHALVGRKIGFLELVDAAAMGGAADHVEVEVERVEDVHDVQHDVRRPQHVAAGIEEDVGRPPLGRHQDALQRLRRKLHAGQQPHRLRHVPEPAGRVSSPFRHRPADLQRLQLGDRHPLADINVLGAGRTAARTAIAGVEPRLQDRCRGPAVPRQGNELAHTLRARLHVEPAFTGGRAGFEAFAAAGATIRRLSDQCFQSVGIGGHGRLSDRLL